jgi:pilus assembly protein CpaD
VKIMRIPRSTLLMSLGLALAGCGPVNRGIESINQPVVSRTDYVFDVATSGSAGLAPGESARLDAWMRSLKVRYGDRITVDDPSGYALGARDDVARVAGQRGLLIGGAAPVTEGAVPAGSVRVVVSRAEASVPGCPNWDRPSDFEFQASTMSNYGCATNVNLARMVANPQDLVEGREAEGVDPEVTARAIGAYRKLAPSGAGGQVKAESAKGGGN